MAAACQAVELEGEDCGRIATPGFSWIESGRYDKVFGTIPGLFKRFDDAVDYVENVLCYRVPWVLNGFIRLLEKGKRRITDRLGMIFLGGSALYRISFGMGWIGKSLAGLCRLALVTVASQSGKIFFYPADCHSLTVCEESFLNRFDLNKFRFFLLYLYLTNEFQILYWRPPDSLVICENST